MSEESMHQQEEQQEEEPPSLTLVSSSNAAAVVSSSDQKEGIVKEETSISNSSSSSSPVVIPDDEKSDDVKSKLLIHEAISVNTTNESPVVMLNHHLNHNINNNDNDKNDDKKNKDDVNYQQKERPKKQQQGAVLYESQSDDTEVHANTIIPNLTSRSTDTNNNNHEEDEDDYTVASYGTAATNEEVAMLTLTQTKQQQQQQNESSSRQGGGGGGGVGMASLFSKNNSTENTNSSSNNNKNNLANRFANWRSKADAVIQSTGSEVLKTAQKSFKDTKVSLGIPTSRSEDKRGDTNNGGNGGNGGLNIRIPMQKAKSTIGTSSNPSNTDSPKNNNMNANNLQSQPSEEDDLLSYANDSYDNESQATSVFVSNAGDDYSINSDTSSVHAATKQHSNNNSPRIVKPNFIRRAVTTTTTTSTTIRTVPSPPTIHTSGSDGNGIATATPKARNAIAAASAASEHQEVTSSSHRGRYSIQQQQSNKNKRQIPLFQQLQQKVIPQRIPTPPRRAASTSSITSTASTTTTTSSSSTSSISPTPPPPPISLTEPQHHHHQQQQQQQQQHNISANSTIDPQILEFQASNPLFKSASAARQAEAIITTLKPGEYVMQLGPGMLGVNLKQTYMEGREGVYVDYIVPNGNACKSKVVCVGDALVKVGDVDVRRKGTIYDVPGIIGKVKRPAFMIYNGQHKMICNQMDNLDVAIGMVNRLRDEIRRGVTSLPIQQTKGRRITERNHSFDDLKAVAMSGGGGGGGKKDNELQQKKEHAISPPFPSMKLRNSIMVYATRRSNYVLPFSSLTAAAQNDALFRKILQRAFITCCIDSRRLPFLAAFLSNEDALFVQSNNNNNTNNEGDDGTTTSNNTANDVSSSTRLMLYLELISFRDLFSVTPPQRRYDHAKRIAYKFLLPHQEDMTMGPLFDMRVLFPREAREKLEQVLKKVGLRSTNKGVDGDDDDDDDDDSLLGPSTFLEFEDILLDSLAGAKVASFLLSNECARMRAYLRGTSPYVDPSLDYIFKEALNLNTCNVSTTTITSSSSCSSSSQYHMARNHLCFMLTYLLCQSENDVLDKNFDKNREPKSSNERVMGSSSGLSCAVYINQVLLKQIPKVKTALAQKDDDNKKNQNEEEKEEGKTNQNHHESVFQKFIHAFEHLWEAFVAPSGGALDTISHSNESQMVLDNVRRTLLLAVSPPSEVPKDERGIHIVRSLVQDDMSNLLSRLSTELIYEYCVNEHPKYRGHMLHEWMCAEAARAKSQQSNKDDELLVVESDTETSAESIPILQGGCIDRMIRRVEFPDGLSRHKPLRATSQEVKKEEKNDEICLSSSDLNADFAVVFGTNVDGDSTAPEEDPSSTTRATGSLRRFVSTPLSAEGKSICESIGTNDVIPSTLESYAMVPSCPNTPFSDISGLARFTHDGWEVSLVNFIIPNAQSSEDSQNDSSLYCVSLAFRFRPDCGNDEFDDYRIQLTERNKETESKDTSENESTDFSSPLTWSKDDNAATEETSQVTIQVNTNSDEFNSKVASIENNWSKLVTKDSRGIGYTIGIVLVANRNTIPAMRETLSKLYEDFSTSMCGEEEKSEHICSPLVDMLGNFRHAGIGTVLGDILTPYIEYGSSKWIKRPISDQADTFYSMGLNSMIESLPAIPLSLLFITALLEQKIVFSSKRRSVLLSVSLALRGLLNPIDWTHLFVPLVPPNLANDLVQYPAPFILGIPSDEKGSMHLLQTLPKDVTLVDIDVGRVVLAKEFASDIKDTSEDEQSSISSKLRAQVLYLAESLGAILGCQLSEAEWRCDSPLVTSSLHEQFIWDANVRQNKIDALQSTLHDFIEELLSGLNTCCFWIEEEITATDHSEKDKQGASNILFDEDRFMHLKRLRSEGRFLPLLLGESYFSDNNENQPTNGQQQVLKLNTKSEFALNEIEFNLVFATLLRGQGMSSYITTQKKEHMTFW